MAGTVINGTTYYRYPHGIFVTINPDTGAVEAIENAAVTLTASVFDDTPVPVLDDSGQPWTPVTDDRGVTDEFLSPLPVQMIATAGDVRMALISLDLGAVIADITDTAAQAALDVVLPRVADSSALAGRLAVLEQAVADLTGGAVAATAEVSWVRAQVVETAAPAPTGAFAFPGSPGEGNMLIGANNGQSTIGYFDDLIWPSATTVASTVREYAQAGDGIEPAMRANITAWCAQGRVPMISFKLLDFITRPATGSYSAERIVQGAADAALDSVYAFLDALAGDVICSFWHEPEDEFTSADGQASFRAASRRVIQRAIAAGVTNVAWASPQYTSNTFYAKSGRDWKAWHPDWTGTGWGYELCDLDGVDRYNPIVQPTSSNRNRSWAADVEPFLSARRHDGARELPWVIGELGVYTDLPELDDNGVTVAQILSDMVTVGAATQGLVAACLWQNGRGSFATADPGGVKATALRTAVGNARVIKITP